MIARAPGKLVLSGAYSVLGGAPALVAAVDRYVVADSERPPERVTAEVAAAIASGALDRACGFDAAQLRSRDGARKLGLGSSAAILVATLAARWTHPTEAGARLDRSRLFEVALAAHRSAQGGGSGVDVAASVFGGFRRCRMATAGLDIEPWAPPSGLVMEVFSASSSTVTADLVRSVERLREVAPEAHREHLGRAASAAERAVHAESVEEWVTLTREQFEALGALGRAAGVPIVTDAGRVLGHAAAAEGATFGPSGAGGGDVWVFHGRATASAAFLREAVSSGLERLSLDLGAPGVHVMAQAASSGAGGAPA